MSDLPEIFKERYAAIVDDKDAFFGCLSTLQPRSFRINTLKSNAEDVIEQFKKYDIQIGQVPWYEDAFISEEPDIGSTFEHFSGKIYMQELVSMLPPIIVKKELEKAKLVLDGCAAPGSKTTQIAAMMQNKSTIVANDISYNRIRALKFNLEKTGVFNTVITNKDLRNFQNMPFDLVFLDAPCSSEGTMRKNFGLFSLWSEKNIKKLAKTQKQLILKAFDLLSPGGVLVYSTCTFGPEENEAVIDHLLNERDATMEAIEIANLKLSPTVKDWKGYEFHEEVKKAVRIWPHHNNTGGFFLAKVRK